MLGNPESNPIETLNRASRPRPDLITPGSTGSLENARPFTYMGRVATKPSSVAELMQKMPAGELEAGGQAIGALPGVAAAGMAKQFKPGKMSVMEAMAAERAKQIKDAPIRIARPTDVTDTPLERMYAALIDEGRGEVINTRTPYRAGDHGGLYTQAAAMNNFQGTRGFVDPVTNQAYTEALLESILQKKHYGR